MTDELEGQNIPEHSKEIEDHVKKELDKLFEEAAKLGVELPSKKVVDRKPEDPYPAIQPNVTPATVQKKTVAEWKAEGYKPGQALPNGGWIPWTIQDLDPKDTVQFVPQDVGTIVYNQLSVNGKKLLHLDVNGLEVFYEVGTLTTTNKMFYDTYKNVLDQNIALENFKNYGSEHAPWGEKNWRYEPWAVSFGLDIDGKSLRRPEWYEIGEDGIPIAINNMKKLASLYFEGSIDLKLTKTQAFEFMWYILTTRIKNLYNKIKGAKK